MSPSKWVYEYEDHTYRSQNRAYNVLPGYICRPGSHIWLYLVTEDGPEVCEKCGLVRWLK